MQSQERSVKPPAAAATHTTTTTLLTLNTSTVLPSSVQLYLNNQFLFVYSHVVPQTGEIKVANAFVFNLLYSSQIIKNVEHSAKTSHLGQ